MVLAAGFRPLLEYGDRQEAPPVRRKAPLSMGA
jgi:hypothetical protein